MAQGPSAADHGLAYDTGSDRTVSFGGYDASLVRSNETWAYDANANVWTNANPPVRPHPLSRVAVAYDSQSDRVILFGGETDSGAMGDTWAFDLDNNVWTNMSPAVRPSNRIGHRMAYDSESDRIILFGGVSQVGGIRNDETWVYDYETNTWTRVAPAAIPPTALPSWVLPGLVVTLVIAAVVSVTVLWRRRKVLGREPPQT